jgi:lysyl-tRNA synthetase class 2
MSSEETLIETRKAKHQELNEGKYPLAADPSVIFFIKHTTVMGALRIMEDMQSEGTLLTTIDPAEVSVPKIVVRGRITNFRKSGAITFIKVTDASGSVQIIVSRAAYQNYEQLKLLDLGDIIEVGGVPVLSKTAEKSLLAFRVTCLTKSHRPPPEKFFGVSDQELKYRKRYLDLMSSEESRARFVVRSYIVRAIRRFMDDKGFLEVETSTLNSVASGANAKPFTTHHNALDMELQLRIAPELYLKRLLVGGMDRVYEIGRSYRNEGIDTRHNPEFTMMESYQAYGRFPDLIVNTANLLICVKEYLEDHLPPAAASIYAKWEQEHPFDLYQYHVTPMWDAVLHACSKAELMLSTNIHPRLLSAEDLNPHPDLEVTNLNNPRLQSIDVKGLFHALSECTSKGEKLAVLFEYVAEPFLTEDYRTESGKSRPVFITEYPKAISPLARANDHNPDLCDRFELFVEGRELANAFQELNDPEEQALRFQEQLESNQKDPMAYDADYIEALEHGMPPAIGFGMGIDRLVMLLTNTSSIRDVILFPTLRNIKQ